MISRKVLREFWSKHADAEQPLRAWFREAERGTWRNANELKRDYPSASVLGGGRVVFNIRGNSYRLVVRINYPYRMMWIRFMGTHAAYDRIDATRI